MKKEEKSNFTIKKEILLDKIPFFFLGKEWTQLPNKKWKKYAQKTYTHVSIPMQVTEESLKEIVHEFLGKLPNPIYQRIYEDILKDKSLNIETEKTAESNRNDDKFDKQGISLSLKQDFADYTAFIHEIGQQMTREMDISVHFAFFQNVIPYYLRMLFVYLYTTPKEFYQILSGLELVAYKNMSKIHFQELLFKGHNERLEKELAQYGLTSKESILFTSYYDNIIDFHSIMIAFDLLFNTIQDFEKGFRSFEEMMKDNKKRITDYFDEHWITYLWDDMTNFDYFLGNTEKELALEAMKCKK